MAQKKQTTAADTAPEDLPPSTTASIRVAAPVTATISNKQPAAAKEVDEGAADSSDDGNAVGDGRKYDLPAGLSKSQKKNMRKALRNKEKKEEEKMGIRKGFVQLPEDVYQEERMAAYKEIMSEFDALPSLAQMTLADVVVNAHEQQLALDRLISAVDNAKDVFCNKIRKPDNRRVSSMQLLEQIREIAANPDHDQIALQFLEDQLILVVSCENARKFRLMLGELRSKFEERQKSNTKFVEKARQRQRMMKLVDRVKGLKELQMENAETLNITASNIVSQEIELPQEAQTVLFPPSNIARRFERCHGVAIDRNIRQSRVVTVTGLEADVREAMTFLTEADFTGGMKVVLDAKAVPGFVGKGGAGIRQLEDNFKCFFQTKDSTVIIYGNKANTQAAISHIKDIKSQRTYESALSSKEVLIDQTAIARALSTKFIKVVRDIETLHAVTIRVNIAQPGTFGADLGGAGASESTGSRSSVTIRGKVPAAVTAAAADVTKRCSELRAVEIEASTPEALNKLFSRSRAGGASGSPVAIRPGTTSRASPRQSVAERFNLLQAVNDEVAFIKNDRRLVLVGSPEVLEIVYDQAKQLLLLASFTPIRVPVSNDLAFLFSSEKIAEIECSSGASIRKIRSMETTNLEVTGTDDQIGTAEASIHHVLETEGLSDEIELHDEDTIAILARDNRRMLRDIEERCGCRIILYRAQKLCRLIGTADNITAANEAIREEYERQCTRVAQQVVMDIPLPSADIIGRIIGQRGTTISGIRENSKVDSIDIDDEKLIVQIKGSAETCEIAKRMISEIISTTASAPPLTAPVVKTVISPSKPVVYASPMDHTGPKWGESVEDHSTAQTWSVNKTTPGGGWSTTPIVQQIVTSDESAGMFPTLREAVDQGKQQKRVSRRPNKQQQQRRQQEENVAPTITPLEEEQSDGEEQDKFV